MTDFTSFKRKATAELIALLNKQRVFTTVGKKEKSWLEPGVTVTFDNEVEVEPYSAVRAGKKFCRIGAFSYTRTSFPCSVRIGRYSAIAPGVEIMGINHPMNRLSMVGFDYNNRTIFKTAREDFQSEFKITPLTERSFEPPIIGNDVWIGNDVLLAQGIRIGHGAVIGARSVVTKDVPDYAVVAGNPARVKKMRFPEPLIEKLLAIRWWDFRFTDFEGMDTLHPDIFVDQLEEKIAAGSIQRWQPEKIRLDELFLKYGKA